MPPARKTFEGILASPAFSAFSPQDQYTARAMLAVADYELNECESAFPLLKQVTATPLAGGEIWVVRFICAESLKDRQDGVASLTTIARNSPASLAELNDDGILQTAFQTEGVDAESHAALLEALYASNWPLQDPFVSKDGMLRELAQVRLDKGDTAGAEAVAAGISDPPELVRMRIDKRFDAIVHANPQQFDVAKALDACLARLRALSAASPDKLKGIFAVAHFLILMGRPRDALSLLDGAIARQNAAPDGKSPFSDPDQMNWVENDRSIALVRLGRSDEAIAGMTSAAQKQENGNVNVSQTINLGGAYDDAAQPQKALDAVANLDPNSASLFGVMQLMGVRACAYAQLQDTANLAKTLDYMKSHAADAAGTYASTLLCADDIDGAAVAYAAQIQDPATRLETLYQLQDFVQPQFVPPFAAECHHRMIEMRSRPVLASAIAKYGRIESFPMSPLF